MSALRYSVVSAGGSAGDLSAFVRDDLFIGLPAADRFGTEVYLKLEGLNIAGSIKYKPQSQ